MVIEVIPTTELHVRSSMGKSAYILVLLLLIIIIIQT